MEHGFLMTYLSLKIWCIFCPININLCF